jgi:hypothetical protein
MFSLPPPSHRDGIKRFVDFFFSFTPLRQNGRTPGNPYRSYHPVRPAMMASKKPDCFGTSFDYGHLVPF